MKLLLFSDTHGSTVAADKLIAAADDADLVIGAGDFARMRHGLEAAVAPFEQLEKPCIFVPGNAESFEELHAACATMPHVHVLHGTGLTTAGLQVFGLGGAVPVTPFGDWSWDFTEAQAANLLEGAPEGCILVTHSPPKRVLDESRRGAHLGSTAVRQAILRCQPRLVVCGHIHESGGKIAHLDTIPIVNAGPAGVIWDLETGKPSPA